MHPRSKRKRKRPLGPGRHQNQEFGTVVRHRCFIYAIGAQRCEVGMVPNVTHSNRAFKSKGKVRKLYSDVRSPPWSWHWWRRAGWRWGHVVVNTQPVLCDCVLLAVRIWWFGGRVPTTFWFDLKLLFRRSSNAWTNADVRTFSLETISVHHARNRSVWVGNPSSVAQAWVCIAVSLVARQRLAAVARPNRCVCARAAPSNLPAAVGIPITLDAGCVAERKVPILRKPLRVAFIHAHATANAGTNTTSGGGGGKAVGFSFVVDSL